MWIKHFTDGTKQVGTDEAIMAEEISFKAELQNMKSLELHMNGQIKVLEGEGEFWQFDNYQMLIGRPAPILFSRSIQRKVGEDDNWLAIMTPKSGKTIWSFSKERPASIPGVTKSVTELPPHLKGKWTTITVGKDNSFSLTYRISKG